MINLGPLKIDKQRNKGQGRVVLKITHNASKAGFEEDNYDLIREVMKQRPSFRSWAVSLFLADSVIQIV